MKKKKKIYLDQDILAKHVEFLLQNTSYFFITERSSFFITKYISLITKCPNFIAKRVDYYKKQHNNIKKKRCALLKSTKKH